MIYIHLPKDLEERLETMAKKTGQSKTALAREAIIEKLSGIEAAALAELDGSAH